MDYSPQFLTDDKGTRIAVQLSITEYDALMEDIADLAVVAERRSEERVSLDDVKAALKSDGLL